MEIYSMSSNPIQKSPFGPAANDLAQYAHTSKKSRTEEEKTKEIVSERLRPRLQPPTAPSLLEKAVTSRPLTTYKSSSIRSILSAFPIKTLTDVPLDKLGYVLCNEKGQETVLRKLQHVHSPSTTPRVHLGFSCWFNFDLLAQRESDLGIICDFDSNMIATLDLMKKAILCSETREKFIELFWESLEKAEGFGGRLQDEEKFLNYDDFREKYLGRGWLKTEESFTKIQNMYREDQIIHRQLDICDKKAFGEIATWLRENDLQFDTLYSSNIPEWLHESSSSKAMYENLDGVISDQTAVLTAQKRFKNKGSPTLSLNVGIHSKVAYEIPARRLQPRTDLTRGSRKKILNFDDVP